MTTSEAKKHFLMVVMEIFCGHSCVPTWINDDIEKYLTGSEIKVLNMIIRQTYGFCKLRDRISYDQFQNGIEEKNGSIRSGTGLGLSAIKSSIDALLKSKVIIKTQDHVFGKGKSAPAEYQVQLVKRNVDMEWLKERHRKRKENHNETAEKSMKSKLINQQKT